MLEQDLQLRELAATAHGYELNRNGGNYVKGSYYSMDKKTSVAIEYEQMKREASARGTKVNISELAKRCNVGWKYANKVAKEIECRGTVVDPSTAYDEREVPRGPGSKSFDTRDCFVLLFLYLTEPSRTLSDYVHWLAYYTGTIVDRSTVSRWFLHAFPISGGLLRVNQVPIDKFKPNNIERAIEYLTILTYISPELIIYGDEKLLKGQELFNRKTRRNVLTGFVPPCFVNSDFRNTYALTGFCSIDRRKPAVCYDIHDGVNDSIEFEATLFDAIGKGYIRRGNVLVLDRAQIHLGKCNVDLQEYMWGRQGILLLFLPARTPEWNPIELVWNTLVQRLKRIPLSVLRGIDKDAVALAASHLLSCMTHDDVEGFYRHTARHNGLFMDNM
jgi:hypothetical protein